MEKGLKTLNNVSRTVARREQHQGSHDPADHDDPHHEPSVVTTGSRRGPSSSLISHPEDGSITFEVDTLIEEPLHQHLPQTSYSPLPYPRVGGADEQRVPPFSISGEERQRRYSNTGPLPARSYTPPRTYSTTSSATTFSPLLTTAPPQHPHNLPGISSLDEILHSGPQMPPMRQQPVTTH